MGVFNKLKDQRLQKMYIAGAFSKYDQREFRILHLFIQGFSDKQRAFSGSGQTLYQKVLFQLHMYGSLLLCRHQFFVLGNDKLCEKCLFDLVDIIKRLRAKVLKNDLFVVLTDIIIKECQTFWDKQVKALIQGVKLVFTQIRTDQY